MNTISIISNKLYQSLEEDTVPWLTAWIGANRCFNYNTEKPYSLLNELLLPEPGEYLSFKQIKDRGGKLHKGSKGSMVSFWKIAYFDKETNRYIKEKDVLPGMTIKEIPILRYYTVFNLKNTDGIPSKLADMETAVQLDSTAVHDKLYRYLSRHNITLQEADSTTSPHYDPDNDVIITPAKPNFVNEEQFYYSLFRLLIESTGHKQRLDRFGKNKNKEYFQAVETITCEIGTAVLLNRFGMLQGYTKSIDIKQHVKYLKHVLGNGIRKEMIIPAVGAADKAVSYFLNEYKVPKRKTEKVIV